MLLEGSIIAVLCFSSNCSNDVFSNNGVFCSICNNYVSNVQFLKDFVLRLLSFADCVNAVFCNVIINGVCVFLDLQLYRLLQ